MMHNSQVVPTINLIIMWLIFQKGMRGLKVIACVINLCQTTRTFYQAFPIASQGKECTVCTHPLF